MPQVRANARGKAATSWVQRFNITDARANLDTIELWTPHPWPGVRREIEATLARRILIEPCRVGYRISINQPTLECIEYLSGVQLRFHRCAPKNALVVSRIDIGVEFIVANQETANELKGECGRHLILRWARNSRHTEVVNGETCYWAQKRANRNLVAYSDKPSRTTQRAQPCMRLELRLHRPAIIANGLDQIGALTEISPHALFSHHLRWLGWDRENEERLIQRAMKQDFQKVKHYMAHKEFVRRFRGDLERHGAYLSLYSRSRSNQGHNGILDFVPDSLLFPCSKP